MPQDDLASLIARLTAVLGHPDFPAGDRAALKRMVPGQPPPLEFYRFALRHLPDNWEGHLEDWLTLISAMALMGANAYQKGRSFGQALAEEGFSEARLERLLAADDEGRRALFLRAVRYLASKGASFEWEQAARLLLTRDDARRQEINRRIATDFYRAAQKTEQRQTA